MSRIVVVRGGQVQPIVEQDGVRLAPRGQIHVAGDIKADAIDQLQICVDGLYDELDLILRGEWRPR